MIASKAVSAGRTLLLAIALLAGGAACSDDLIFSASNLDIGPDPARPGDDVVATFVLTLVPSQRHTITLTIGGVEVLSESHDGPHVNPVILELGDAAELLADHGAGEHAVRVAVELEDSSRTVRTESVVLELVEGTH